MTMQIQLRRWSAGFEDEGLLLPGEQVWDDVLFRYGIKGGDNRIHWSPSLRDQMEFAGPLSGSDPAAPTLTFEANAMVLRTRAGVEIARFAVGGTSFNNATIAGVYPQGSANLLVNGAFQCLRSDATTGLVDSAIVDRRRALLAPNWLAWSSDQPSSRLDFDWSDDVAPVAGAARSLRVTVGGTGFPTSAGVRTFCHDTTALRAASVASVWLRGPLGARAAIRAINENALVAYQEVVGSGAWKQYTMAVLDDVFPTPGRWAALDALYCPQGTDAGTEWLIGPTAWHPGETPANYPLADAVAEQARVAGVYAEPRVRGTTVSWNLLPEFTTLFGATSSDYDHTGATLTEDSAFFRVVAARIPPVPAF